MAYKITDADIRRVRARFWAEKVRQEREEIERDRVPLVQTYPAKNGGVWA